MLASLPKAIPAMVCITAVLVTCVICDQDGIILSLGITAIAGLGGFLIARHKNRSDNGS